MVNHVMINRDLHCFPDFLLDEIPEFRDSEEFNRLTSSELLMPGILVGAFTRYFSRLQQETAGEVPGMPHKGALNRCYAAIEKLASSSDPEVQNLVVVDIFETLHVPEMVVVQIEQKLGPVSKALYERWIINSP